MGKYLLIFLFSALIVPKGYAQMHDFSGAIQAKVVSEHRSEVAARTSVAKQSSQGRGIASASNASSGSASLSSAGSASQGKTTGASALKTTPVVVTKVVPATTLKVAQAKAPTKAVSPATVAAKKRD